jgi:hypothetical protein
MPRTTTKKETTTPTTTPRKGNGGTTARKTQATPNLTHEDRHRMIAEAAYYKALHRNFQQGDPTNDWLMAEQEIDARYRQMTH